MVSTAPAPQRSVSESTTHRVRPPQDMTGRFHWVPDALPLDFDEAMQVLNKARKDGLLPQRREPQYA